MQKDTKIAAGICAVIVGLLIVSQVFMRGDNGSAQSDSTGPVVMENGIQVIAIAAKGGYSPQSIQAQSGVPTELRVTTNGTYDCSSTLVIPALGYDGNLKATGTEIITISADQAQGTLDGTCGMGMYNFEIAFK
jgi:plastocyanin domain-containing protein